MRWLHSNLIIVALTAFLTVGVAHAAESLQMLLADTTVNHVEQGEAFLLWDGAGEFYAAEPELIRWRVRPPYPEAVEYDDRSYYRIRDLIGATAELDTRAMAVKITLPPNVLRRQRVQVGGIEMPDASASRGLYLDYDISYVDLSYDRYPFAMLAPTFFSEVGVVHSEFMYRGAGSTISSAEESDDWVRLDTTFTRDDPARMRAYRAGDVFSAPGPWGTSLRLGGVQVASNFNTRPAFVTFPVPSVEGASTTPSTVDLFVDGVLRHRENVDSGFFRIDDVPAVTGAGQLTMVVTDIMGRQQTLTQDFYASAQLLREGLTDYSYSLGLLRRNFGYVSNDYGEPVFIGAHRLGVNESLTLGGRVELSERVQMVGSTADWSPRPGGVFSTGFAVSNSARDLGASWLLGYEWRDMDYRIRAQATGSSRNMAVVDPWLSALPQKLQLAINAGLNTGIVGSLSGTYVHQSYWGRGSRDVLTVNYSTHVREVFLNFYTSVINAGSSDLMIGMTVTRAFGERRNMSSSAAYREDETRLRFETQQQVPVGPGFGYRLGATLANSNQYDGTLIGQTEYGRYSFDARNYDGNSTWRAGTQGSLAWLAGRPYATRRIADGFAVARVGDIPNVRVYLDNHEIGRSDEKGRILLPSLRPYEANRVRIAAEDLPLGAQVDELELRVAPYFRSGTVVDFPVRSSRQAILHAVLENGDPVPDGAVVRIDGRDDWSIVGMDGMIYLTDIGGMTQITVTWLEHRCELTVALPETDEPLPNIGRRVCEASEP